VQALTAALKVTAVGVSERPDMPPSTSKASPQRLPFPSERIKVVCFRTSACTNLR